MQLIRKDNLIKMTQKIMRKRRNTILDRIMCTNNTEENEKDNRYERKIK